MYPEFGLNMKRSRPTNKRVSPIGPIDKALLSEIIKQWKNEIEAKGNDGSTVSKKMQHGQMSARNSIQPRTVELRDRANS